MNFNQLDSHKEGQKQGGKFNRQRSRSNPPENDYSSKYQAFQKFENPVEPEVHQPVAPNFEHDHEERKEEIKINQEAKRVHKIDMRFLQEGIKDMKIPIREKSNRKNDPPENWKELAQSQAGQMKGILQHFQDFIPWDFQNMPDNIQSARHHDIRNCPESIYRVRKPPRSPIKSLIPNEPYLKLTVLRTSFEKNSVMEHYVTSRGMLGSNRNTDHDDIMIGRQQATADGIVPNDICLYYSDRAISRVHAKIVTKYGFSGHRKMPEDFLAFLMMSHQRLGAESPGFHLPEGLYRHIFSFIKEPKKFWIVDLGSSFGTYVKLKAENLHPLEKGQTYLVGLDTYFNIIDVKNVHSKSDNGKSQRETISRRLHGDQDDFIKYLYQERVHNKCEIHGLTETEENMLELMIANHKDFLNNEDTSYIETERCPPSFNRPCLKLEVQNYGGFHSTPNHIFVGEPQKDFVVGRLQECDVNLTQNTAISRKQCRFVCQNGLWYIADGAPKKKSANGTWISLTDYRLKRDRAESEPREIENGTEIKINDTVIQVEICNNE